MILSRSPAAVSGLSRKATNGVLPARVPARRTPALKPCLQRARIVVAASSPEPPAARPEPTPNAVTSAIKAVEDVIKNTFNADAPGQRKDWKEVEGAWVLPPPEGRAPQAVVHFLGAAFVGAVPQFAYRLFLEALSNRDVLVVATPYTTNFDQLRIADEAQFSFEKVRSSLGPELSGLPVYGVGHGLGGVVHLLISSRYASTRGGNAFLGYNNAAARDIVPFLSPLIAPGTRLLGPLLASIAASPARSTVESALDTLRSVSPSVLRQLAPLLEQLAPLYLDVSQGRQEWSPSPEETHNLIRTYYNVERNLLLRFKDDSLDETNDLAGVLQSSPAVSEVLDLSVRTLPGDTLRPLQQVVVDLPPDVARMANNIVYAGGDALGKLADVASQVGVSAATGPLNDLSRGVANIAGLFGGETGGPLTDSMQSLADEVAAWMGTGAAVISGSKALPAKSVFSDRPAYGARGSTPSRRSPTPAL